MMFWLAVVVVRCGSGDGGGTVYDQLVCTMSKALLTQGYSHTWWAVDTESRMKDKLQTVNRLYKIGTFL